MQSRLSSLAETMLNTASGFLVSLIASLFIFPAIGVTMNTAQNIASVSMFTVVSVIRSYLWRRLFNHLTTKKAQKL